MASIRIELCRQVNFCNSPGNERANWVELCRQVNFCNSPGNERANWPPLAWRIETKVCPKITRTNGRSVMAVTPQLPLLSDHCDSAAVFRVVLEGQNSLHLRANQISPMVAMANSGRAVTCCHRKAPLRVLYLHTDCCLRIGSIHCSGKLGSVEVLVCPLRPSGNPV